MNLSCLTRMNSPSRSTVRGLIFVRNLKFGGDQWYSPKNVLFSKLLHTAVLTINRHMGPCGYIFYGARLLMAMFYPSSVASSGFAHWIWVVLTRPGYGFADWTFVLTRPFANVLERLSLGISNLFGMDLRTEKEELDI